MGQVAAMARGCYKLVKPLLDLNADLGFRQHVAACCPPPPPLLGSGLRELLHFLSLRKHLQSSTPSLRSNMFHWQADGVSMS